MYSTLENKQNPPDEKKTSDTSREVSKNVYLRYLPFGVCQGGFPFEFLDSVTA